MERSEAAFEPLPAATAMSNDVADGVLALFRPYMREIAPGRPVRPDGIRLSRGGGGLEAVRRMARRDPVAYADDIIALMKPYCRRFDIDAMRRDIRSVGGADAVRPIEVQLTVLTSQIKTLTEHFRTHRKDNHSRRGLLKMVNQRRKLLDHVRARDEERYRTLIRRLGIRK